MQNEDHLIKIGYHHYFGTSKVKFKSTNNKQREGRPFYYVSISSSEHMIGWAFFKRGENKL